MEEITGVVEHIIYRNEDNGYSVFAFDTNSQDWVAVGSFSTLSEGESLRLHGEACEHPIYGEQFKVESYEYIVPSDEESILRYLSSGVIKGIGPAMAKRIVAKFGDNALKILEEEPECLTQVKGISERIAMSIGEQASQKRDIKDALLFLQNLGISNTIAFKIYETYKMALYSIMRENPYRLVEDIQGIGFHIADEIASRAGVKSHSEYRIKSAILFLLSKAMGQGHMYLLFSTLLREAVLLLDLQASLIEVQIQNLQMEYKVFVKKIEEEQGVFSASAYYCEMGCAKRLADLNKYGTISLSKRSMLSVRVYEKIEEYERESEIQLDPLQKDAIVKSACYPILILTGGPGTGKTTTINTMIRYFEEEGYVIALAAPTGRAAKRMTQATGYEAKTIHRLLELNAGALENGMTPKFERNEDNPLEADIVLIDELSMVDIFLFMALLKATANGAKLIFVGDMNQLPSVGPGRVLKDLVDSKKFECVELQTIFRQARDSDIVMNAHFIKNGKKPKLDNQSKDFFFLPRQDPQVIYKHMVQLIQEKLPKYVESTSSEIQVLTPMRKGPLGVEMLNKILQNQLNMESDAKKEKKVGDTLFREGDKVMQVKNNYKIEWEVKGKNSIVIDSGVGVFNGDIGRVIEINSYAEYMLVEMDEGKHVQYSFSQLEELELAYAVTIHKSQGSEYPAVIIPILGGPKMLLNRNLLYTAVTRAKKCVTILGSEETILEMIENGQELKRYSDLNNEIVRNFESEGI